jgi:hypothetical protein
MASAAARLRHSFLAFPKLLYVVLLIILCILFADVKTSPKTFDSSEAQILEDIFTNVHVLPINKIETTTTGTCSDGFTAIVLGYWNGTYEGCSCTTANTLTVGACASGADSTCTTVTAVGVQKITSWSGSTFCVQRVSAFELPSSAGTCPTTGNTQLCTGSQICIPAAETCPVNIIKRVATGTETPTDYTSITLNSTFNYIYANNEASSDAITDLAVSLYDLPCMNPFTMPYTTSKKAYALSKVPETNCNGTGTVDHLLRIERKDVTSLFTENNLNTYMTALPKFSDYIFEQDAYIVGLRQYKLVTTAGLSCGTADPAIIPAVISRETSYKNLAYGTLIAAIVIMSIVFFTTLIEFVLRFRGNQEEEKWMNCFWYINLFLTLVGCILLIVVGGAAIQAKVNLSKNVSYFNYLAKYTCFQETIVNRIVQVYQGNISNFYAQIWLSIALLIISCVGILVTIILGLINAYAGGRAGESGFYKKIGGGMFKSRKKNGGYSNNVELSSRL